MDKELDHFLRLFIDVNNPTFYSFLFIILFLFLIVITYQQIIIPRKLIYEFEKEGFSRKAKGLESEKNRIESDALHIFAAFTESDPNPILRTDLSGIIIQANISAQKAFGIFPEERRHLSKVIDKMTFEIEKEIGKSSSFRWENFINEKHYTIFFYGISSLGMAQVYFFDLTEMYENEKKLQESEQKFRSLSFYLHDELEAEKQRIGMELHDSIGQNLLLVNLKIKETGSDFDNFDKNLSIVQATINTTIKDLREIMYDLRPRALDDLGIMAAVLNLSERISNNYKIKGSVDGTGPIKRLEIKNELYLYRIIQEALNNILKHSFASEYHIQFIFSREKLKVLISDNGVGFDPEKALSSKGFGLLNMSERIKNLKGKMDIESGGSVGTLIIFQLPI